MFDFVVVGAGSAGCVLANRLSADGKRKVALLEAGGRHHKKFLVRAPGGWPELWRGPLDWQLTTEPQAHCDDRRHYWPRGKLLGGSSCLNALIYIRGHRDNYDEWRDLGNPGWGYDDVLPYFKKSENNSRGASAYHGADGPLHVSDHGRPSKFSLSFAEAAARRCKVSVTDDFNGADQEGAGIYQFTVRNGQRASTASSFLDPIRGRENLTVITNAHVTSLVVDGDRVTGLRYRSGSNEQTIEAKEIVLAGGAIGSVQILLLSGIGPADELRALGIAAKHDLAGVGKNLQDHLFTSMTFEGAVGAVPSLTKAAMAWWALRYLVSGGGPLAVAPTESGAFVRSSADRPRPDLQFMNGPYGFWRPNTDEPRARPLGRLAGLTPCLIYPRSVGEIRLRSKDPMQAPVIDPRYFSDPADLELLVTGVKLAREIAATGPLAKLLGPEIFPGPAAKTDDDLRAHVRLSAQTIFHPVGTCKMGPVGDRAAVVDPQLRVHGIRGLRVADASIMPRIIGGNTNAPTIMIAEKCADLALA